MSSASAPDLNALPLLGAARKMVTDRAKEREFYRYYNQSQRPKSDGPPLQPACPASPPLVASSTVAEVLETIPPHSSHDKALTAFAQLGALRLDARRCLISFFDRKNCYVLAEATRTLSLKTGRAQFREDDLAWGTTVFPKEQSICYYTVNLPPQYKPSPTGERIEVTSLIVNDLASDSRFKNYPFVAGLPYSRFYAGVPIKSPAGHNIGTYCILDENPRHEGISSTELSFLKDMASTVMRHLEMTRATDDHRRGGIMVRSLGCFAEGKSSLEDWWEDPWEEQPSVAPASDILCPDNAAANRSRRPTVSAVQPPIATTDRSNSLVSSEPSTQSTLSTSPESGPSADTAITPPSEGFSDTTPEPTLETPALPEASLQEKLLAPDVKSMFVRAATIIQEATEADGAVFFDASIGSFGGLVDEKEIADAQETVDPSKQSKPCVVLGSTGPKPASGLRSASLVANYSMTEGVLRHLVRTYPRGQIFNFDDDTESIHGDSEQDDSESTTPFPDGLELFAKKAESAHSQDDELLLRDIFPRARTLVLYPLWDAHRERWFAGAIIWSADPMRVFTSDQELCYLAAFGNSVMAEVARLDTKLADNAKADFISSISHELRSPLHGILGSCELLKDTRIDTFQLNLIQTIETCGKTLLDTINHVLDFAKINNLASGASKQQKGRLQSAKRVIIPERGQDNDIMTLITDIDLGILTEEVLETVFAGYSFQKAASAEFGRSTPSVITAPNVCVIIDICKSSNWLFRTQPGAWRRVLMNLFGNALKYTEAGYIKVRLYIAPCDPPLEDISEVKLIISDSGIGISDEYLRTRLWHSFAQEDPLSQGTGLGLSIVKQIVNSLGGSIDVQSKKGVGTRITVTCPLKQSMLSPKMKASLADTNLQSIKDRTTGMKVVLVAFDGQEDDYFPVKHPKNRDAIELKLKTLEITCQQWFGMEVIRPKHPKELTKEGVDLFIAFEAGARLLREKHNSNPNSAFPPVIVVCHGAASAHKNKASAPPDQFLECIPQPVGPHKLAKALISCLKRHSTMQNNEPDLNSSVDTLTLKENQPPQRPKLSIESFRPYLSPSMSTPSLTSQAAKAKSRSPSPHHVPLSILAVDDNPINLRLLRTFIDKLNHTHMLATNGLEAVNIFKAQAAPTNISTAAKLHSSTLPSHYLPSLSPIPSVPSSPGPLLPIQPFDVILMDINMPQMDGLEATRQIRAHERDIGVRAATIIALTGLASAQAQNEAFTSGVNLFLIKPVRLSELEVVLKGVVTGKDGEVADGPAVRNRAESVV